MCAKTANTAAHQMNFQFSNVRRYWHFCLHTSNYTDARGSRVVYLNALAHKLKMIKLQNSSDELVKYKCNAELC